MEPQGRAQMGQPVGVGTDLVEGRLDGVTIGGDRSRDAARITRLGGSLDLENPLVDLMDALEGAGVGVGGQERRLEPDAGAVERPTRRGRGSDAGGAGSGR